ncbi:methyltransferase domain-containing protein [Streptomyces sp. NPDC018964]|uniref:methyltransferase domain-containing protein n=1 Tax=Streptomyces sp. NPDC018964 TaxID=3365058 RepID=UPI0037B1B76E
MYRHAMLGEGCRTLVRAGTGYGTALACHRLGADLVTSVDIDDHLVQTATDRLHSIGLRPRTAVCDLTTAPLPGAFDRIVSTGSVRPIPAAWLKALRPGGRPATAITGTGTGTGTGLILIADKTPEGGGRGYIAYDRASFMSARHGDDYDTPASSRFLKRMPRVVSVRVPASSRVNVHRSAAGTSRSGVGSSCQA